MKLNKIIAIIVLLLFALGTFAPIALAKDGGDYQQELDNLNHQFEEVQGQYNTDVYSVIEFSTAEDATTALTSLNSLKTKLSGIQSKTDTIRTELLSEASQGNFQSGDGSEKDYVLNQVNTFVGKLSSTEGLFKKAGDALTMIDVHEEARLVYTEAEIKLDELHGLQAEILDLIAKKGDVNTVGSKMNELGSLVNKVKASEKKMQDNNKKNELVQQDFANDYDELQKNLGTISKSPGKVVEYGYAYFAVYSAGPNGIPLIKSDLAKVSKEHNTLLCAKKSTDTTKIALTGIRNDINDAMETMVLVRSTATEWKNGYLEADANKLISELATLEADAKKAIAQTVGTDCSSTPTPTPVVKDEWIEFSDLDNEFDDIEKDYFFYKKKVEKARTQKDSKDEKKYEDKLKDLDDNVEDLAKKIKNLDDKVGKNTSIKDQKKLLSKIENLEEDAEELEDDIEKSIKGTASTSVTPSSSTISVNNFVPKNPSSTSGSVLVEKINFPTFVETQPVVQEVGEDSFAEVALLIGGIVIIIVVIMFLLAAMLIKKK